MNKLNRPVDHKSELQLSWCEGYCASRINNTFTHNKIGFVQYKNNNILINYKPELKNFGFFINCSLTKWKYNYSPSKEGERIVTASRWCNGQHNSLQNYQLEFESSTGCQIKFSYRLIGRTSDFESENRGSNPCKRTKQWGNQFNW